ncbi:hypothetical protein EJ08DRAFT_692542 [Tothia fuscella]|uniref:Uncharacterized protein n=1 Tax=Tothia fuscella TaxID=1048955 RepID=A0A9P4U2V0_9PEZI|nr:hypothetical protein EJ08DRAFT_692542 [Tothia fuscella]
MCVLPVQGGGTCTLRVLLLQIGKQIHDKGTTVGNAGLEIICNDFDNAKKTLDARIGVLTVATEEEKQVKAIAVQTAIHASKLEKKLVKLRRTAGKSKSEAVKKAFKAVWSRNDILKMGSNFLRLRDELTLRLVLLLNGKVDAEAIKQSIHFTILDDSTKQIIQVLLTFQHDSEI